FFVDLRRMWIKAIFTKTYDETRTVGTHCGVGEFQHPEGAHALGDLQAVPHGQPLISRGPEIVARVQLRASSRGRTEHGIADPELLRGFLGDLSAAVGVGEVRYPVGAHAL